MTKVVHDEIVSNKDSATMGDGEPVSSIYYPMLDGKAEELKNARVTTVTVTGVRMHREFEATIKFFGPPPFYFDTDEMTAVSSTIDGKPTRMRLRVEIDK